MAFKNICFIFIISLQLTTYAQHSYWQQQVNHTIDVSLNDAEHSLNGFEKIEYTNNSPDTLSFIWFHLWPNAFKNDQTAFSRQLLVNNRTDFYFSEKNQRGYINRLDFKVNGVAAKTEDHPQHIDIIMLVLPTPLAPGQSINITTPFHVQLPENFSRGGHTKQAYQVTQWYPKPAVYDHKGWHPMPYLDQGEFYNEFGNYDVRITLPADYVVAATGQLQNVEEVKWLKTKGVPDSIGIPASKQILKSRISNLQSTNAFQVSSGKIKTIRFLQNNVHDFAWFADQRFIVKSDTLKLSSGKVINVFCYYLPPGKYWGNSIRYIKEAVTTRSAWLGEYPYNTVSAVEAAMGFKGGMEYPTITSLSGTSSEKELDFTIAHEIGHNWFYAILAGNERLHPWMDEGMNTFYDNRHTKLKEASENTLTGHLLHTNGFIEKRLPADVRALIFETFAGVKKDQPINTSSENFTGANYGLVAYFKTGEWVKELERHLGKEMFDSCMQAYYRRWQFKHPYPEDFKMVIDSVSGANTDLLFEKLDERGSLHPDVKRTVQFTTLFNLKNTDTHHYISLAPAAGVNLYDGLMIGGVLHNYQLPLNRLNFFIAPLYAVRSKQLNALARVSYSWYPDHSLYKTELGIHAFRFTVNEFEPQNQDRVYLKAFKLAPFLRVTLKQPDALSKVTRYVQLKSFFFNEDHLDFRQVINGNDTSDVVNVISRSRNLYQLKFVVENARILYPYKGEWNVEQQKDFVRLMFTGDYYFNYANRKNGLSVRIFAGKFIYTSAKTASKRFDTDRYHLNLTGPDGYEDYTYSNYFSGRNKFENWASQQIMIRDGGFKVRTNLLSSKVGKTDNWLIAANLSSGMPENINPLQVLPFNIPLKVFADIGTYAESWKQDGEMSRFLFDAGLQLSLFKETVNVYVPLMYSDVFRDYFRSALGTKRFLKTVSFSIDIHRFNLKQIHRDMPF